MAGSWSNGFKSLPSGGAGISRSKGLERKRIRRRNPMMMRHSMPMTYGIMAGWVRQWSQTAIVLNVDRIKTHNSSEPSWPPQTAATV